VGKTSSALQITAENGTAAAIPVTSVIVTGPFLLASNACGNSLAANSDCELTVEFAPTQAGAASGTLTIIDEAGTQTVALSGTGASAATDTLSPLTLSFPATVMGQLSAGQSVALTNDGDVALHSDLGNSDRRISDNEQLRHDARTSCELFHHRGFRACAGRKPDGNVECER
jgi:hypothetical protein